MVTQVLQDYAEEVGMLNDAQEGFRKQRSTSRQLQTLVQTLKDAKVSKKDIVMLKTDLSSAFNSVDHPRLFEIMRRLGMPQDAVAVVRDLYTGAHTRISTSNGNTETVSVLRGSI